VGVFAFQGRLDNFEAFDTNRGSTLDVPHALGHRGIGRPQVDAQHADRAPLVDVGYTALVYH